MNKLIFVYGALRSGTTLFRLMLDAHKELSNPGEVDFIFDYLVQDPASDKWTYDFIGLRLDRVFQSYNLDVLESDDGKDVAVDFVKQFLQRSQGQITLNIHKNMNKVSAIFPDARVIHIIRDPRDVAWSCIGMGWAALLPCRKAGKTRAFTAVRESSGESRIITAFYRPSGDYS